MLGASCSAATTPDIGGRASGLPRRPNIVFILADDMGIASLHAQNPGSGVPTPHLDRLVAEGMVFTDAHSGSAVCSPTRYGVLTGRYSWRTRMRAGIVNKWERPLIDERRWTVADLLRQAGYHTACIGKWHLGWHWPDADGRATTHADQVDYTKAIRGGPLAHGFDEYFGDDVPNWPPYVWIENDRAQGVPTGSMARNPANGVSAGAKMPDWSFEDVLPTITQRCVDTIARCAEAREPLFLYFAMTSPHTPINPSPRFQGRSGVSRYADFLMETDWAVGEVLRALDEHGLRDNTLVIFTADNGTSPRCQFEQLAARGVDLRQHWRGHKADVWEGGHRVPFVARWPGVVEPGSTCDEVICLTDFLATAADVVGLELPDDAGEDSVSLLPALRGQPREGPLHDGVVLHSSSGFFAIRAGRWKLAFCRGSGGWSDPKEARARELDLPAVQLYAMDEDPAELRNLQAEHPEVVAGLTAKLREIVTRGRSTPGEAQANDGPVWWRQLPWPDPRTPQANPSR